MKCYNELKRDEEISSITNPVLITKILNFLFKTYCLFKFPIEVLFKVGLFTWSKLEFNFTQLAQVRATSTIMKLLPPFRSRINAQCIQFELMWDHQNKDKQSNKWTRHSLCSHLGHQVKRSKASIKEVVSVAAHLDGIQPVAHSGEGGVVRHTAVEERLGGPTEKERSGDKKREREG